MSKTVTPPQLFNDSTPMPFGKYQGKKLIDVPAQYFLWLYNKGCDHVGVKKYIISNLDALQKEAGEKR